ncbi:hypothetical protein [Thalassotalea sediminis]|uniref:hypothetical protein n=1 Tax=Thalassotalea sediminis TaxID=1759089 RepID=UPI002573804E|nr:hypothetical protein [Thalassotalea sediminis]
MPHVSAPLSLALGVLKNMRIMDDSDNQFGFVICLISVLALLSVVLSGKEQWLKYIAPIFLLWGINCVWAYFKKKTIYGLYFPISNNAQIVFRIMGLAIGILFIIVSISMYT